MYLGISLECNFLFQGIVVNSKGVQITNKLLLILLTLAKLSRWLKPLISCLCLGMLKIW